MNDDHSLKGKHNMADKERIANILNMYRGEIRAKGPKSYSIWQGNRTVMPAGVGSPFRVAGAASNDDTLKIRCMGRKP